MPERYRNKYRIASTRLASWDYGSNAAYFITICTHNRAHAFGEVADGVVGLTPLGQATWDCWYAIPDHFPFVLLDVFVAMPNHVHGIVMIDKPKSIPMGGVDGVDVVETQNLASLQLPPDQPNNKFGPQSGNLASVVRGFKIGVTKYARRHQIEFTWQPRYHDHIIRNDGDFQRIRQYILNNPKKWAGDTFYM